MMFSLFFFSAGRNLESDMEENSTGKKDKFPYSEKWENTFDWVERSNLGEQYTYCRICARNIGTFCRGSVELEYHEKTNKHKKKAKNSNSAHMPSQRSDPLPCSDAALQFIHKHCFNGSATEDWSSSTSQHFAQCKLGLQYPEDITSVCQRTPYCVYIYRGVTVGKDDTVSVLLVGFFDVDAGRHRVRFLDAVPSDDDDDVGDQTAAAVGETLKKFGLPTDNLVAIYSEGSSVSLEQMCSQLREFNPNTLVFTGLYGVGDAACQAGVKQLSNQIQELVADIHSHCCHSSTENDNFKALFGSGLTGDSPAIFNNMSCLNVNLLVKKLLESWTELMSYFTSYDKDDEKAKSISSQLQDPKVRATFMFLEHALTPLQTFQTHVKTSEGDPRSAHSLSTLTEASNILSTYTSYFLHPQDALRFLVELDTKILKAEKHHLSSHEIRVGGEAVRDFLSEFGAAETLSFVAQEALSFYIGLTECISKTLPLRDELLRNIALLLNPKSKLKVTGKAVGELGSNLGICGSPEEIQQLTEEFLKYQSAENVEENASLEEHWTAVLRDNTLKKFPKLMLTLLCLPCPPLDGPHLFTQVWFQCCGYIQ